MFDLISKLSFNRGTNIGFIIFGAFIAPQWFLFQFANTLYTETELVKLIFLSCSIGIPCCLLIYAANMIDGNLGKMNNAETKADRFFTIMGVSCVFSGFAFYIPCALKYFAPELQQRVAVKLVIYANIGYIIPLTIGRIVSFFSKKKQ